MIICGYLKEDCIIFTCNQVAFGHLLVEDCIKDAVKNSVKFKIIDGNIKFIEPTEDWFVEEFDRERMKRANKVIMNFAAVQTTIPFDFKAVEVYDKNGNFKIYSHYLEKDNKDYYRINIKDYYDADAFDAHMALSNEYYLYEHLYAMYKNIIQRGYITNLDRYNLSIYTMSLAPILKKIDKCMFCTLICFHRYIDNKLKEQ